MDALPWLCHLFSLLLALLAILFLLLGLMLPELGSCEAGHAGSAGVLLRLRVLPRRGPLR
jgi:hypothetical protein